MPSSKKRSSNLLSLPRAVKSKQLKYNCGTEEKFSHYSEVIRFLGEEFIRNGYNHDNSEFVELMKLYVRWNKIVPCAQFGNKISEHTDVDCYYALEVFTDKCDQQYKSGNRNRQYNGIYIVSIHQSRLKDAGRGLFAMTTITKNTTFSFYIGAKKKKDKVEKVKNAYRFELRLGHKPNPILDPVFPTQNCFHGSHLLGAHYANDKCLGTDAKASDKRIRYNSTFEGIFLVATCEIRKGSEVFVDYNYAGKESR